MRSQKISFANRNGEQLAGVLDLPEGDTPQATALFAHCFTCNKNLKSVTRISRALNQSGIAVLRFDFTGLGDSEGDFSATNFTTSLEDLIAAAEHLAGLKMPPTLAIGHSLGGTAMLMAAANISSLQAIVTIGAPGQADHVTRLFAEGQQELAAHGEALIDIGGRPFRIKQQLIDDLAAHSAPDRAARLKLPLLVMHSPLDEIVSIEHAAEIFTRALHPKSFISLDRADHLLSNDEDAQFAGDMIAAWSHRYLDRPVASAAAAEVAGEKTPAADDRVRAETGAEGFRTELSAEGHQLLADEPASVGGTNTGPSPYGLLAAALASCTSMTLQMYARRKGLQLDKAGVSILHRKIHAEDCTHCTTKTGKIDRFDRHISLSGDLTEAERKRLLEIADMCPVHRTLLGEIDIQTFAE